jgi:hypothetical protein
VATISEKHYKAIEKALLKQQKEIKRSKESAIKALIGSGIIDAAGNFKKPYESLAYTLR